MRRRAGGDEAVNRLQVFGPVPALVERAGRPLVSGPAEVIDQQVARHGGDPDGEAAARGVKAGEVGVDFEENVLRKVFGVCGVAGEAVAKA